jgi:hypothetical protein
MDLRFCASGMREQGYGKLVFSLFFFLSVFQKVIWMLLEKELVFYLIIIIILHNTIE